MTERQLGSAARETAGIQRRGVLPAGTFTSCLSERVEPTDSGYDARTLLAGYGVLMSRTVSHIPARYPGTGGPWHGRPCSRPHRQVSLRALRYSAAHLTAAARRCRRPIPEEIRHHLEIYDYASAFRPSAWMGHAADFAERRARQTARLRIRRAVLLADFEDADILPWRHRHGALWDSW